MPRPKRKIVLLLCEGKSDKEALWIELSKIFENSCPECEIVPLYPENNGYSNDITTEALDSPDKIEGLVNKVFINKYLEDNKLYPKDIDRIIHVVDLDGAYIPDECIVENDGDIIYESECILCKNPASIKERNQIKSSNINYLSMHEKLSVYLAKEKGKGKLRPYSIYFFSSNLDHVLHGDANINHYDKVRLAREFAKKCSNEPGLFARQFKEQYSTGKESYQESWEFIKEGTNSLKPYSNLDILIRELENTSTNV